MNTFPKEQVIAAYNKAPDAMRAAFNDEKTTELLINLQKILQFEPVLAPILGREVGYLLVGLTTPDSFRQRLKEAHFPDHIVSFISAELTQKVLLPIVKERAKLQPAEPISEMKQTQQPKVARTFPKPGPMNVPIPSYGAPPPQSPAYTPVDRQPEVVVSPLQPRGGVRPAVTITPDMAPPPRPQVPPTPPPARAIVEQPKELPVGEEPHISAPIAAAPVVPPVPVAAPTSEKEFKTPPVPVRSSTSSDPYREPIE